MKKLLVVIVILGVLGGAGYYLYSQVLFPRERRACMRVGELCGGRGFGEAGMKRCEAAFEQLYRMGGKGRADDAVRCILASQSCLRAAGCMGGVSLGVTKDLFDGIRDVLGPNK